VSRTPRCVPDRRLAGGLLLALTLAACRSPAPVTEYDVLPVEPPTPAVKNPPVECTPEIIELASGSDGLLQQLAAVRSKSGPQLKQEYDDARRDFGTNGGEAARLRFAALLLMPGTAFRNEAQAAQLLEPYNRPDSRARAQYRGVAQLLLNQLEQARRQDAAAQAQAVKLKDEQKRTEELQRKLDALKDVERAMIQKDQGAKTK
jgi:hypothetical protein